MRKVAAYSTDKLSFFLTHPLDTDQLSLRYSSMPFQLLRALLWMKCYHELPFFILGRCSGLMISMNLRVCFVWLEFYLGSFVYSFITFISLIFRFVPPFILIFFTFITAIFFSWQFILIVDDLQLRLSIRCYKDPQAQLCTWENNIILSMI